MKRILIDGRFIGVGESISRYVLEITKGILSLDQENKYSLLIRPQGEKELDRYPDIINAKNLEVVILDIPHYSKSEQTELLKYLNQENFDLVHFTQFNHPIFYKGNFVTTIHDLTLVGHLHYHNFVKQLAYNIVMKDAAKRSKEVIAISAFVKKDVVDFFNLSDKKFKVIYHGLDHERYNAQVKNSKSKIESFKEKYNIKGDYILYTGAWKKHKNLTRLLKAFEEYKVDQNTPIQLVLVGKIDQKEPEVLNEIEKINKEISSKYQVASASLDTSELSIDPIITTGFIEEDELPIAYAGALFYVIPSLSEGFGWPPLEAMACNTPVIASKESCIPEILGDAAYYFDPYNIDEIKNAIGKFVGDKELRDQFAKKGLEQVKKYNWAECAQKTLSVYKEIVYN